MGHPLISRAQQAPEEVASHGAERIIAIKDRVWFKVKTGVFRGAVGELHQLTDFESEINAARAWWWLGAAGKRQQDSETDFYRSLTAEVQREGKGTGTTSSTHLLPNETDFRRLRAELGVRVTVEIRRVVRTLVAESLKTGRTQAASLRGHRISACVRAHGDEAYLAVSAEGFIDPNMVAIILGSVPHITADDWLPEPDGVFGIDPKPGQIIYSAMISARSQAAIMDEFTDDR